MIKLNYSDQLFNENELSIEGKHYETLCMLNSDINEHLPTLKRYTEQCNSVTELGVRYAFSTWAFIEGKPKKLNCYDIDYESFKPSEFYIKKLCNIYNISFNFKVLDSLKDNIENTDLLFIDTLHTYNQLLGELNKHSNNVNKWIILHDTVSFGYTDEKIYEHASDIVKNSSTVKRGLNNAIDDFLSENKQWIIKEIFTNNNGLTVLEKINIL